MKQLKSILFAFLAATIIFSGAATSAFAESASSDFSAASSTQMVGATFPVTIYEDSGSTRVVGMSLELLYDPAKLELVGVDKAPGNLMDAQKPIISNGKVAIMRITSTPGKFLTGSVPFATVNFKALANSGSTSLQFGRNTEVYAFANGDVIEIWNKDTTGVSITFRAPAAAPAVTKSAEPTKPVTPPAASPNVSPVPPQPSTLAAETTKQPKTTSPEAAVPAANQPIVASVIGETTQTSSPLSSYIALVGAAVLILFTSWALSVRRRHKQA